MPTSARDDETTVAWCFRFLQGLPNVKMVLSGMSNEQQIVDNIATFEESRPLSPAEGELILKVAEELKGSVPCTGCRYCVAGCPMGLDIPFLLSVYNDLRYAPVTNTTLRIEALPESKKPDVCVGCGKCSKICPQNIDIPGAMQDFCELMKKIPSWEDVCRERAAAERKNDFVCMEYCMTCEEANKESSRCLRCDHFGYGIFKGGRVDKW